MRAGADLRANRTACFSQTASGPPGRRQCKSARTPAGRRSLAQRCAGWQARVTSERLACLWPSSASVCVRARKACRNWQASCQAAALQIAPQPDELGQRRRQLARASGRVRDELVECDYDCASAKPTRPSTACERRSGSAAAAAASLSTNGIVDAHGRNAAPPIGAGETGRVQSRPLGRALGPAIRWLADST